MGVRPPVNRFKLAQVLPHDGTEGDGGTGGEFELLEYVVNAQSNLANGSRTLPPFVTVAVANGGGTERPRQQTTYCAN